jgi:hypothetical protein
MKQTAVEWLYKLSKQRELDKFDLEQAKVMEKEQMKDIYMQHVLRPFRFNFEEYYNETYNK